MDSTILLYDITCWISYCMISMPCGTTLSYCMICISCWTYDIYILLDNTILLYDICIGTTLSHDIYILLDNTILLYDIYIRQHYQTVCISIIYPGQPNYIYCMISISCWTTLSYCSLYQYYFWTTVPQSYCMISISCWTTLYCMYHALRDNTILLYDIYVHNNF